jgi:gamma-glutamyltranspeptidase / glutathione hydrolase
MNHKRFFNTILLMFLLSIGLKTPLSGGGVGEQGVARSAMVVSEHRLASDIGIGILRSGGNAIDAAVATGLALAVVYPEAGNLGGGGFMVIRFPDGTSTTIDYRETAPLNTHAHSYTDDEGVTHASWSLTGARAAGVPGTVAGLFHAWQKYGSVPFERLIDPAIRLAREGFELDSRDARTLNAFRRSLSLFGESMNVFFPDRKPHIAGDRLIQHDLANTLERIRENGHDGFYRGTTADLIVESMKRHNGWITQEDLLAYNAVERPALRAGYRGYEIVTMGLPSSGGAMLVQMLTGLSSYPVPEHGSDAYYILYAELMKRAYEDRNKYLGDPDYVDIPMEKFLNPEALSERYSTDSQTGHETTHYSVIDEKGIAVSVTTTINSLFGSKLTVEGAGFLLNNEMNDFSLRPGFIDQFGIPGSEANKIEPGKRMLSSMTPTIVLKDGEPVFILGARGGPRIITTVFQVLTNYIDYKMDLGDAVGRPRIHHQWSPDLLEYFPGSLGPAQTIRLKRKGYTPVSRTVTGRVAAISIADGLLHGATTLYTGGGIRGY